MLRKYPYLPIVILALAAVSCLVLGIYMGQWMVGLGGAVAGLCLIGLLEPVRRRFSGAENEAPVEVPLSSAPRCAAPPAAALPEPEPHPDGSAVDQMLAQGRYALLLRPQIASTLSAADVRRIQEALDVWMSIVPGGPVMMRCQHFDEMAEDDKLRTERRIDVDGFY